MGRYLTSDFNAIPREQWAFGQVLEWHLVRGTRPGGALDRAGRRWSRAEFAGRTGLGARTIGNWLTNQHLPPETETIERVLFGNDACYSDWRLELRHAHARSWAAKDGKSGETSRSRGGKGRKTAGRPAATGDNAVQPAQDEHTETHPRQISALPASNIPIRVPTHFTGREDELRSIEVAFARQPARTAILALLGLRGIGKTTLAAAYAERHRRDFQVTWWIRAHSEPLMRADIVALGARLGWVRPEEREDWALSAVMERLVYDSDPFLLIYDNAIDADSLRSYLPRGGRARVLATSNFHAFRGLAEPIEVGLWSGETGAGYLLNRTGRHHERGSAEALSKALDGLPLAHEQAACYCDRLGVSLPEYLRRLELSPKPLLDDQVHAPADYNNRMTVARSFTMGIEEAAKIHPGAEPLIVCASLMALEPVPLFLFAEAREDFDAPFVPCLAEGWLEEAVAALRSFALLKQETTVDERNPSISTETIRLHRLVREIAAARRDAAMQDAIRRRIVTALAKLYPRDVFDDPATWPRARRLDEHARRLLASDARQLDGIEGPVSQLLNLMASYRQAALADYASARELYSRALSLREKAFGANHDLTATSLQHLGRLVWDQGDLAAALELFERALAIRENVLGPDHPATATSLNLVGGVLQAQAKFASARPLMERALAIREKVLGPDHPRTATSVINMARVLRDQGEFAEANPFAKRGLAIRETVVGAQHPRTAAALNVLGVILQGEGHLSEPEPLFMRALDICETVLGPEHPYTATTLTNLALLRQAQGDLATARALVERALDIRERVLGPEHPSTAMSLNDLGNLLREQRDLEAARLLFDRALAISEKQLGPGHPATAASLEGLGRLHGHDGDGARAKRLFQRALRIRENSLGPRHPATIAVRKQLGGSA
jgi:tetratricopeptide (TPR) repeat protein